ncbi:MAG TPA: TonB-dependent receptor plug domain-containing protein, partial [Longimicrobiaceae bacterium]|nr:TonB-dependent receptor plug domain-containing protein [Longimicrobiaceae bacterium]
VLLAPLTVTSERMPRMLNQRLERRGYYERKERFGDEGMGFGKFLEKEEIGRYVPSKVTDILQTIPGVQVRGESVSMRRGCTPAIFLDGVRWRMGSVSLNDIISISSVVAIEVYKGSVMPAQYMHFSEQGGIPCGAIAVWTGI